MKLGNGFIAGSLIGLCLSGYSIIFLANFHKIEGDASIFNSLDAILTISIPLFLAALISGILVEKTLINHLFKSFELLSSNRTGGIIGCLIGGLIASYLVLSVGILIGYLLGAFITIPFGDQFEPIGTFIGIIFIGIFIMFTGGLIGSFVGAFTNFLIQAVRRLG